jgi:hypothetical protein
MTRPPIIRTTHTLPFDKLSPRDFERLCLWLVERRLRTRRAPGRSGNRAFTNDYPGGSINHDGYTAPDASHS